MDSIINKVYKYGQYYNPSQNHYKKDVNVVCDRCHKSNLKTCIGYDTYDLCMGCIESLSKMEYKSVDISDKMMHDKIPYDGTATLMTQNMYRDDNVTYMRQEMYDDRGGNAYNPDKSKHSGMTRMMQRMFRK